MSIFNPWAEVRKLKAQLEAGYETYRVEETQQQAEWAKKGILLKELERSNAVLRRENEKLRRTVTELKDQLAKAVDPRDPKTGRFTKRTKR
jgi:response regulator RpfG family c-di-GMP phosphodiesterase